MNVSMEEAIRLLKKVSGKAYAKDAGQSEVFCRDIIAQVGEAVRNSKNVTARQSQEPYRIISSLITNSLA